MNDMADTDLAVLPAGKTALEVFTSPDAIEPILAGIRQVIDGFKPDVSTSKGRKAIGSIAHRVAQAKVRLDDEGKKLADQQKEIPKKIDATRKRIRDTLDQWKAEVRAPLTEWEQREDARIQAHRDTIAWLQSYRDLPIATPSTDLTERLLAVEAVDIGVGCEEFAAEYAVAKDGAIRGLKERLNARKQVEAAEEEERRRRQEAEARAAEERDRRLKEEAAAAARREVEERAERERQEAIRREDALKAEAAAAERRAADAEAAAQRRQEEAKRKADEEAKRRADDVETRRKANRAACNALIDAGLTEEHAKLVIKLIANGGVPHVAITY